ncbi:MAG: TIR domain-containing protein [Chthoniobacterales bacterium]
MAKRKKSPQLISSTAKRSYVSQAEVPKHSLEEAVALAEALQEHFNGEAAPHELANAMSISPTSSAWQSLTGAASAFGLTEGGYNAATISLAPLGARVVAPEDEGDDVKAIREAALLPRIFKQFFQKYDRGKFPQEAIGFNVLTSMGAPRERAKAVYDMVRATGLLAGFITNTKTGLYVALSVKGGVPHPLHIAKTEETDKSPGEEGEQPPPPTNQLPPLIREKSNTKVFITHGKNRAIVEQLKEILKFGKFEPVVAVEHETPSKPVPEKVLEDMRSCFASVIHVESEQELMTPDGEKLQRINENVLIEIGASLALYGRNFVLLVKKGIHLPSNLQGLYCCFYEGDKLDYEATMKLLKAFNEFR